MSTKMTILGPLLQSTFDQLDTKRRRRKKGYIEEKLTNTMLLVRI